MLRVLVLSATFILSSLIAVAPSFGDSPSGVSYSFYQDRPEGRQRLRPWSRLPNFDRIEPLITKATSDLKWGLFNPADSRKWSRYSSGYVYSGKLKITQKGLYSMLISARGLLGAKVSVEMDTRSGKILRRIYTVNNICDRRAKLTRCNELRRGFKTVRKLRLDVGEYKYRIEGYSANAAKAGLTVRLAPPVTQDRRSRRTPSPRFYPLSNYSVLNLPEGINGSDIDFSDDFTFIRSGATGPNEVLSRAAKFALNLPIDADVSLKNGASFDAQFCASCHSGLNPDPKAGKNLSEILYALKFNASMAGVLDSINAQAGSPDAASQFLYEITAHNNRNKIEVILVSQDPGTQDPNPTTVVRNPDGSVKYIENAVSSNGKLTDGAKEALAIPISLSPNINNGALLNAKYCAECHPGAPGGVRRSLPYDQVKNLVETLGSMASVTEQITSGEPSYEQALADIVAYLWRGKLNVIAKNPDGQLTPTPIQDPDVIQGVYSGTFGFEQAKILCERFLFSCANSDIQELVSLGLDQAVASITRAVDFSSSGPDYDDLLTYRNILCYGDYKNDDGVQSYNNPRASDPFCQGDHSHATDIYLMNTAMVNAFANSRSNALRFRLRYLYFLHDERMSMSYDFDNFRTERYPNKEIGHPMGMFKHHEMLWNASMSMDYKDYLGGTLTDYVLHGYYLDGFSNTLESLNENFAREFWELGSTGTHWHSNHENPALRDQRTYQQIDVSQASKCLIGLGVEIGKVPLYDNAPSWANNRGIVTKFFPEKMATDPSLVVFAGTPWQKILTNSDPNNPCPQQLLSATLAHPATAEHLAYDILKEYLHPEPDYQTVKTMANMIRTNNYNVLPAMKWLMKSEALYSLHSRNALIKHPIEIYLNLMRIFPTMGRAKAVSDSPNVVPYELSKNMIRKKGDDYVLEQVFFNAPSVFGYYPEQMMSAGGQLSLRRFMQDYIADMHKWGDAKLDTNQWERLGKSMGILPTYDFRDMTQCYQAVDFYAGSMRISLTTAQRDQLAQALNGTHAMQAELLELPRSGTRGIDEGTLIQLLIRLPQFYIK